jgi:hypothetical protein
VKKNVLQKINQKVNFIFYIILGLSKDEEDCADICAEKYLRIHNEVGKVIQKQSQTN